MSLARHNDCRRSYRISGRFPSSRPFLKGRGGRAGYTLVELLIVVSILLVFAGLVIPRSDETGYDQLLSAARVLASDLAYARSLAVANNDQYLVSFSGSGNSYTLQYNGSNPTLINLPSTPFRSPTDPPSQQIQRLADLPEVTASVKLVAAADVSGTLMTAVTNVQFNGLGGTTRSDPTWIWLASGVGSIRRYLVITINPVTGLTFDRDLFRLRPVQFAPARGRQCAARSCRLGQGRLGGRGPTRIVRNGRAGARSGEPAPPCSKGKLKW